MGEELGSATLRKATWHVLPVLFLAYLFSYIDRVNVGFAALTANKDLGLSHLQYGFGAGLFFLGYCAAQVPSNMIMLRVGARTWFARILITMGVLAVAMMAVVGPKTFYAIRLGLGIAEAGLVPGVVYYLRCWFPQSRRANVIAMFLLAIPLSSFLGSPISGALLGLDGLLGLRGWQWMYLLEGLPCIIFGLLVLVALADTPNQAAWLTPEQRQWLNGKLAEESASRVGSPQEPPWWRLAIDVRVLCYGSAFFGIVAGSYGLSFWLPQIVKSFGLSNLSTGFVVAIPFGFGSLATILWARHSDRSGERLYHTALPAFVAAAGLAACIVIGSPILTMVALTVAALGIFGIRGPFYALVAEDFADTTAAPAIAWTDTFAALGGFFGPTIVGWLRQSTGGFSWALFALAFLSLLGGAIIMSRSLYRRHPIIPASDPLVNRAR